MSQQPRVQFFDEESSFGSESLLGNSRYNDLTSNIIHDCRLVLTCLKSQMQPIQSRNKKEKVDYIISRARILHNSTVPEHVVYLRKSNCEEKELEELINVSDRVGKLLFDFEEYGKGQMTYKQLYKAYGTGSSQDLEESKFKKSSNRNIEPINLRIQPQQIIFKTSENRGQRIGQAPPNHQVFEKEQELLALKEQLRKAKKSYIELQRQHEKELAHQKLLSQTRIINLLRQIQVPASQQTLLHTVKSSEEMLSAHLARNIELIELTKAQDATIIQQRKKQENLKSELEANRRLNNSFDDADAHDKSYSSEMPNEQKASKATKNLKRELQILKNQLNREREGHYHKQTEESLQDKREIERLKRKLEAKTKQCRYLESQSDKFRLESIKLAQINSLSLKKLEGLKTQNQLNEQHRAFLQDESRVTHYGNKLPFGPLNARNPTSNKTQVSVYEGDGVEGSDYYSLMSKEFQIRFKRACLKEKQLLYKHNFIEVGVVSTFTQPNTLNFEVYVSNYGDTAVSKVALAIINLNMNETKCEEGSQLIKANEQVKVGMSVQLKNYPIGPVLFRMECMNVGKYEQLWILLPAHVVKTFKFQDRTQKMKNPVEHSVPSNNKIIKSSEDLMRLFKVNTLKISAFHQQTHTLAFLDLEIRMDQIKMAHQHTDGEPLLTDYLMRTLSFLLSK